MSDTTSPIQVALVAPVQTAGPKTPRDPGQDGPDSGQAFALLADQDDASAPADASESAAVDLSAAGLVVAAAVLQAPEIAVQKAALPTAETPIAVKAVPDPQDPTGTDGKAHGLTVVLPTAPLVLGTVTPPAAENAAKTDAPNASTAGTLPDAMPAAPQAPLRTPDIRSAPSGPAMAPPGADRTAASPDGTPTVAEVETPAPLLVTAVAAAPAEPSGPKADAPKSSSRATPQAEDAPESARSFALPAASAFAELVARHGTAVRSIKAEVQPDPAEQPDPAAPLPSKGTEIATPAIQAAKPDVSVPAVAAPVDASPGNSFEIKGTGKTSLRTRAEGMTDPASVSSDRTASDPSADGPKTDGQSAASDIAAAPPVLDSAPSSAPADTGLAGVGGTTASSGLRHSDAAPGFGGQVRTAMATHDLPLPQIAQATIDGAPGVTEIRLSPEELGSIRMDLRTDGDRATLVVSAERPETLDLLRRNADRLASEFRAAGFQDLDLGFGRWGGSDDRQATPGGRHDPPAPSDEPRGDWPDLGPTVAASPLALRAGAGLYARF